MWKVALVALIVSAAIVTYGGYHWVDTNIMLDAVQHNEIPARFDVYPPVAKLFYVCIGVFVWMVFFLTWWTGMAYKFWKVNRMMRAANQEFRLEYSFGAFWAAGPRFNPNDHIVQVAMNR